HWEAEGDANDEVGNIHGVPRRGVSFVPGKTGRAFHFDGLNSGIELFNPAALHLQNLTIAAWIKRDDPALITRERGIAGTIFSTGHNGYEFGIWNDGLLVFDQSDSNRVFLPNRLIADTNWHHVAVAKNRSKVTFFIDGTGYPASADFDPAFTFTR